MNKSVLLYSIRTRFQKTFIITRKICTCNENLKFYTNSRETKVNKLYTFIACCSLARKINSQTAY